MSLSPPTDKRRNKGFDLTHSAIIEAAVRLISSHGIEALSMAGLARSTGINRTTLYYHFADRNALLQAVKQWSAEQLTRGITPGLPRTDRIRHMSRFVLENPDIIRMWIEDFLAPGDIRDRYPQWDALVEGIGRTMAADAEPVDAEVYCVMMITAAFIGPGVFRNSVRPDLGTEEIAERFMIGQRRMLRRDTSPEHQRIATDLL